MAVFGAFPVLTIDSDRLSLGPLPVLNREVDPRTRPSWYFTGFYGQAAQVLGTSDIRAGFGFAVGHGKPEPRFRYAALPAQLVYEFYVDTTQSPGVDLNPANRTYAVGALAISRWFWPVDKIGNYMFFDIGWGLQYADKTTVDLDSQLNSTPVIGFGGLFPLTNGNEFMLGVRLLHVSNAGTKGHNLGQNEILLTLGVRF